MQPCFEDPGWRRSSGHPSKPTPYHGVISPSHRRPGLPPGPHKLNVLSTFTICGLLLTSTWSGLYWAAFGGSWSHLGVLSGSFWVLLGASWAPVGPSGAPVGCSWGLLGLLLGALKLPLGALGASQRVNASTGRRGNGQPNNGVGLGVRFGGATPLRSLHDRG